MKKILLCCLLSVTVTAYAQVPSSCNVPPALASVYYKDIAQLSIARLFQVQSPDTALIKIPQADLDSVSEGLAAILNATSIPESDSVFNLYCVHNNNGFPFNYAGFLVRVDTNYSWTQAWQSLITLTGNSSLDSFLIQYDLHVVNFYNWSIGNYAELTTDSAWNIMALMDSLSYTPGIISVEPNYIFGMEGRISYNVIGNIRYYDFYFEFNDCFDGCDNYHKWSFSVDANCSVTYLGYTDWGVFGIQPLPAPVNCNLFSGIKNPGEPSFNIFPNPVDDKLFVSGYLKQHSEVTISIYNISGKVCSADKRFIKQGNINLFVNTHDLAHGLYFINFTSSSYQATMKFIKN